MSARSTLHKFVSSTFLMMSLVMPMTSFAAGAIRELQPPEGAPRLLESEERRDWAWISDYTSDVGTELRGEMENVRYIEDLTVSSSSQLGTFRYFSMYGTTDVLGNFRSNVISLVWEEKSLEGRQIKIDQWQVLLNRDGQMIHAVNNIILKAPEGHLLGYDYVPRTLDEKVDRAKEIVAHWLQVSRRLQSSKPFGL